MNAALVDYIDKNTVNSVDVKMSAVPVALNMVRWPPVASAVPFVPWSATTKKA